MRRRVILEQDDNYFEHEEYVPGRGESFYHGFSGGLVSAGKVVLVLLICIIIYLILL
jgi:hypothetical protein